MPFKRDKDRIVRWKKWIACNRATLVAIGIPEWIYADEIHWWRFVQEGGLDEESGWSVQMLTSQQANQLREFFLNEFGFENHACFLKSLDSVLGTNTRN